MSESKLPKFESVEKLVQFFERGDMGKFWDEMPEAKFDVNLKNRTFLISVDGTLMKRLSATAKARRTSTKRLVHAWLSEKLAPA